jgi:hypothetical protein
MRVINCLQEICKELLVTLIRPFECLGEHPPHESTESLTLGFVVMQLGVRDYRVLTGKTLYSHDEQGKGKRGIRGDELQSKGVCATRARELPREVIR